MLKNLFGKIRNRLANARAYLAADPKRAKFLGLLAVAVFLPLIIVSALTIQNLKQRASENGLVEVVNKNGNPITETADPNVYLRITLPNDWVLSPSSPQGNNLIKQAYAASCVPNSLVDTCTGAQTRPDGVNCPAGEGVIKFEYCNAEGSGYDDPTYSCSANCEGSGSFLIAPTATPVPLPAASETCSVNATGCTGKNGSFVNSCGGSQSTNYICNAIDNCIPRTEDCSLTNQTCVNSSVTGPFCRSSPTPTPAVHILKGFLMQDNSYLPPENKIQRIFLPAAVWDGKIFNYVLESLQPSEESALRKIDITLVAKDGFETHLYATVTLTLKTKNPTNILSRVEVSFNCTDAILVERECHGSALAYDTGNWPMYHQRELGITYSWGISSSNSIGTLSRTNGDLTSFIAQKVGVGTIWVIAQQGNIQVQKSRWTEVLPKSSLTPPPGDADSAKGALRVKLLDYNSRKPLQDVSGVKTTIKNGDFSSAKTGAEAYFYNLILGQIYEVSVDNPAGYTHKASICGSDCQAFGGQQCLRKLPAKIPAENQEIQCLYSKIVRKFALYDLNNDGVANCKDAIILTAQYGRKKGPSVTADFNQNGTVDEIDYNELLRNYTPGDTTVCNQ